MSQTKVRYKNVKIDGETYKGTFEQNPHGWFVHECAGIHWNYKLYGGQEAKRTAQSAAKELFRLYHEYGE